MSARDFGNTTICQYYKLSEYIFVSEIFVNIPNVIISNVMAKALSKVCILMIIAISSKNLFLTYHLNIISLYDMDFSPISDHKYLQFEISNE